MAAFPTVTALQAHARALAKAFNVRLIESEQLRPEEALGIARLRVALCSVIVDETTYAVALHEIGHLAAPTGTMRTHATATNSNLMRDEEEAAWTWARHYALVWTPLMDALAHWAEGTYQRPAPPTPTPQAPVAPTRIDWTKWSR